MQAVDSEDVILESSEKHNMGITGRNAFHKLVENLEREAHRALAHDASFLETLQILKWEVDSDARVKAAVSALRNRGLGVFHSFAPRVYIRLHAGESTVALPSNIEGHNSPDCEYPGSAGENIPEHATQALRDAASAVVSASAYCGELEKIVNEALQASAPFERLATGLERAGYRLQVVLDLSTYARARTLISKAAPHGYGKLSKDERPQGGARNSPGCFHLPLSGEDVKFLRGLRIAP